MTHPGVQALAMLSGRAACGTQCRAQYQRHFELAAGHVVNLRRLVHQLVHRVPRGIDLADSEIAQRLERGDLVITADIPLAADVIERGGHALNPRGEFYTPDNIRERLALRDFLAEQRGSGVQTGGPPPLDQTDRKRFADQLDRFLTRFARA